jgi:hypothetical protein
MKMDKFNQILSNLNERYVLVKISEDPTYIIADKKRRTIVNLNDPIINYQALILKMLDKKVEVYHSFEDLPEPIEHVTIIKDIPPTAKVYIKKIYDEKQNETGAIIGAVLRKFIGKKEKDIIEEAMKNYAFSILYPQQGLNIYSNEYSDIASIIVIKDLNSLPYQEISENDISINLW